jgi:hypothetical protein
MAKHEARRITRDLTPEEQSRLAVARQQIAAERDELILRDQMRKEARDEATLSGELRRAVHASEMPLTTIAKQIGVPPVVLDEFLTGERTLRSDVLDRLADSLGYVLTRAQ